MGSRVSGRPSSYTDARARVICDRMHDGETLTDICADDDMPHRATVYRWLDEPAREGFRDSFARARTGQIRALEDAAYTRAMTGTPEPVVSRGKAVLAPDGSVLVTSRPSDALAIKLLEGRMRDTYGRHVEFAGDPDKPLNVRDVSAIEQLTDEQIAAELAKRS